MNSKKRIAILGTRGIPAAYGGFETFAEEISARLVEAGHEVTVFCEAADTQPDNYKGVSLKYAKAPSLGPLTTIVFDLLCLLRCIRGYDIVYMLGYGASPFCFLPRLTGTKVWINMDGLEWKRSKWSPLAKAWLKMTENIARFTATRLLADAASIADDLRSRYRHLPDVSTIAYGAPVIEEAPDETALADYDLQANTYYLLVCRLEPENHVLEILDGYLESDTERRLVVVGNHRADTPYVAELLKRACERIAFVGTIYDAPVLQAIRYHAYGYLHGHSVGGTNPSLLEALGAQNAIIAHDNPFNREVAADSALYFSQPSEVAATIERLEREPGLRASLQGNALRRVSENYTWTRITGQYIEVIAHETDDGAAKPG